MKAAFVALALSLPGVLTAQDTVVVGRPGGGRATAPVSRLVRDALAIYNAPSTTRVRGPHTIGPAEVARGDLGILDGPVRIAGEVAGTLVAINADVDLRSGALVHGDLVIVGGTLTREGEGEVRGTIRLRGEGVAVREAGDTLALAEPLRERRVTWTSADRRRYSSASLVLTDGDTYNRVEGLPLRGGVRIAWGGGGANGRIEAVGIFRTAGDFRTREDIGYAVGGRLRLGSRGFVELGARAHDEVTPIPSWQLEDNEIGLATFLWHRDYRDYYLSRGTAGYVTVRPARVVSVTAQVARTEDTSIAARNPWTLFRRGEAWRENPPIDEGHFTLLTGRLEIDSRRTARSAGRGWLLRAEWERGRSDDVRPVALPVAIRVPIRGDTTYAYDWASVDLRRYERIGWSGQLRLRALAAGSVGGERDAPLPIQRRVALGGPGLMPGYTFRELACGEGVNDPARPALCDRMVLFQAEYRGDLSFGLFGDAGWDHRQARSRGGRDRDDWGDLSWVEGPRLVLFGDAGTAWLRRDEPGPLKFDLGAGLEFGTVGVYAARALRQDAPIRWTIRVDHRF